LGTVDRILRGWTREIGRHANVAGAVAVVFHRDRDVAVLARLRRGTGFGLAVTLAQCSAVDVLFHLDLLAFFAFKRLIDRNLFLRLPRSNLRPVAVFGIHLAHEFVDRNFLGVGDFGVFGVDGLFDDDLLDEPKVVGILFHLHLFYDSDVFAVLVHTRRSLCLAIQHAGFESDNALFFGSLFSCGLLLRRAGAGDFDLDYAVGFGDGFSIVRVKLGESFERRRLHATVLHGNLVIDLQLAHLDSLVEFADFVDASAGVLFRLQFHAAFALFRRCLHALLFLAAFGGLFAGFVGSEWDNHWLLTFAPAFSRFRIGCDAFHWREIFAADPLAAAIFV